METRSNYVMVGAVTVALLAGVLLFIVWLAGLSNKQTKCFDIYFAQAVGGLNKGSNVTFSGVPVGQVEQDFAASRTGPNSSGCGSRSISRRRCSRARRAQIKGVGFTGVSEIQLDGAVKGSAADQAARARRAARSFPASSGGLGALLNSAPELIDRIQRLTERLTELLSDKNQNAIADILENIDKTTKVLAERAPDLADAIARCADRGAQCRHRRAATSPRSPTTPTGWSTNRASPAAEDLRKAIASVQQAADNLNAMITDARPGVQNFTKSTLPEANRLVRDLRELVAVAAGGLRPRRISSGIGGTLGPEKLPDYKPGKRK